MTQEEMKKEFYSLYNMMANSQKVENMRVFGNAHKEMMEWFIANKPDLAQDWIDKLESIKWHNYLSTKEAEKIVAAMNPKAPWTREQWKAAMNEFNIPISKEPWFNSCALYTTMNMIMSDSGETLKKYIGEENLFKSVYDLAVDKLTDADKKFNIRYYFGV